MEIETQGTPIDLAAELIRIAEEIGRVRTAITLGSTIEVDDIAGRIDLAAAHLTRLEPSEAARYRNGILNLLADLSDLKERLDVARGEVAARIGTTGNFRKAVGAYNRPNKR